MIPVFADTSYFVALIEVQDTFHAAALDLSRTLRRPLLTTSAILLELGSRYAKAPLRPLLIRIVDDLNALAAEIVHVDGELQSRGMELFRNRADKHWSLTDCISFVVMKERGVKEAATADEHFHQAGFVVLLRQLQSPG